MRCRPGRDPQGQRVVAGLVVLVVVLVADDPEVLVELHVDLGAVVQRDLHLVEALLVADLGLGHPAAARVLESGGGGPVEVVPGDRRLVVVATAGRHGGTGPAGAHDRQATGDGDGDLRALVHGRPFVVGHVVVPHGAPSGLNTG